MSNLSSKYIICCIRISYCSRNHHLVVNFRRHIYPVSPVYLHKWLKIYHIGKDTRQTLDPLLKVSLLVSYIEQKSTKLRLG